MAEADHVFSLLELNRKPELFEQPEELYIMLLDYVYTDRYNCQAQYEAIVQYCEENNYLVNARGQFQLLNNNVSAQQFTHALMLIIVSFIARKEYSSANQYAQALLHDMRTKIQDFQLQQMIKDEYGTNLNEYKIFGSAASAQLKSAKLDVLATMITSIA